MSSLPPNIVSRIAKTLGSTGSDAGSPSVEGLLRRTRRQLYECARHLGLPRASELPKEALARRLLAVLQDVNSGTADDAPVEYEHIRWGYGADRVTAMVIDPERLYVYWEVTDLAIERARRDLGASGPDAWLCLRVYDVTGRIFDGTNAHSYFDHAIARDDRQWFFFIGKPASTAVVELGLQSHEGFFVRIARSGRAEFPRREPVRRGVVEWLTVSAATGEVHQSFADARPPVAAIAGERAGHGEPVRVWDIRRTHAAHIEWMIRDESFGQQWLTFEWTAEGRVEWEGDVVRTSWEAGPFSYPVAPPAYIEERLIGGMTVRAIGDRTQVVWGPWHVVIRGLGARAERKLLGVWEIRRSWVAHAGVAAQARTGTVRRLGASEQLRGASERRWLAGSERRLRGASEIFMRGASEVRHRGASETLYGGASEFRFRGASEQRARGASEQRVRGASEQRFRGASEWRQGGASEQRLLGASERRHGGASERLHLGASEHAGAWPPKR